MSNYDGCVYPSYMHSDTLDSGVGMHPDNGMYIGEVVSIVYPDSDKSHSGKYTEYAVEIVQTDSENTATPRIVYGCTLQNVFGGGADRCVYTLRPDANKKDTTDIGLGATVLLAFVNGQTSNAVIIGCIKNIRVGDKNKKDTDTGHHYEWEFNGHRVLVDKEGQTTLSYNGPTKIDGTPADSVEEDKVGSKVVFDKSGSINIVPAKHDDSKVFIGGENAKENLLLAKTYRDKESSMHQTLQSKLTSIKMEFLQLNLSFTTATTDCTVATITKLAADMTKIGTSMQALMNAFGEMADAIGEFENSKKDYLSKKNFND